MSLPTQTSAEGAADNLSPAAMLATEDLVGIVNDVWNAYLNAEGDLVELPGPTDRERVMAAVSVSGGWSGHVVVELSLTAAKRATSVLLAMEEAEAGDEDVSDAVGELANMVGGNIKSLLPGPSALSLPVVAGPGSGSRLRLPEAAESTRADLTWGGEPVTVSVWTATDVG